MVLLMGQSNAEMMVGVLPSYFGGTAQIFATGGSSLLKANASTSTPTNYWVEDDYTPGQLETAFYASGLTPTRVIWLQGEQDATRITTLSERNRYKVALNAMFNRISAATGCNDFGICVTGQRLNSNKEWGISLVRDAQHTLAAENSKVSILSETYDLDMQDHVHYSTVGRHELLARIETPIQHPFIKSAALKTSNKKRVLIEIGGAEITHRGSTSNWLFNARNGMSHNRAIASVLQISETLFQLAFYTDLSTSFFINVAYDKRADVDDSGSEQFRNEHLMPLLTKPFPLTQVSWT